MKKATITSAIMFLCFTIKAQTSTTVCTTDFQAKEGTFEIISHTKQTEVFTTEILCQIESRRDEKKIIDWEVSAMTTIRILPKGVTVSQEIKN